MRVEAPEEWADQEPRRRWPWWVAGCAGAVLGLGALYLVSMWSWFDAGGTLGGYGAAPDAFVDETQYDRNMARRTWVAALVAGFVPATYAAWRAWTARTAAERRRALVWLAIVVVAMVIAGSVPAIVHASA